MADQIKAASDNGSGRRAPAQLQQSDTLNCSLSNSAKDSELADCQNENPDSDSQLIDIEGDENVSPSEVGGGDNKPAKSIDKKISPAQNDATNTVHSADSSIQKGSLKQSVETAVEFDERRAQNELQRAFCRGLETTPGMMRIITQMNLDEFLRSIFIVNDYHVTLSLKVIGLPRDDAPYPNDKPEEADTDDASSVASGGLENAQKGRGEVTVRRETTSQKSAKDSDEVEPKHKINVTYTPIVHENADTHERSGSVISKSSKPCLFMEKCYKADCPFDHGGADRTSLIKLCEARDKAMQEAGLILKDSTGKRLCRAVNMKGGCRFGSNCNFSHEHARKECHFTESGKMCPNMSCVFRHDKAEAIANKEEVKAPEKAQETNKNETSNNDTSNNDTSKNAPASSAASAQGTLPPKPPPLAPMDEMPNNRPGMMGTPTDMQNMQQMTANLMAMMGYNQARNVNPSMSMNPNNGRLGRHRGFGLNMPATPTSFGYNQGFYAGGMGPGPSFSRPQYPRRTHRARGTYGPRGRSPTRFSSPPPNAPKGPSRKRQREDDTAASNQRDSKRPMGSTGLGSGASHDGRGVRGDSRSHDGRVDRADSRSHDGRADRGDSHSCDGREDNRCVDGSPDGNN